MNKVLLPIQALNVSKFAFGTAQLYRKGSLKRQIHLLHSARDSGFTHFDTAPIYADGMSEEALGRAFYDTEAYTITTKIGLYPKFGVNTRRSSFLLKRGLSRLVPALSGPKEDYGIENIQRNFSLSLSRLRRGHIDFLMLHEPNFSDPQIFWVIDWMRSKLREGSARFIGLAGELHNVAPAYKLLASPDLIIQTRADSNDVFQNQLGRLPDFTYGHWARLGRTSSADQSARSIFQEVSGSIIVFTTSDARLREYCLLDF